jgi:predicted ester cyclase
MGDAEQELARDALERVCAGRDASAAEGVYSHMFHDHVNGREYVGHDGIRQSLALYQLLFRDGDLEISVVDQVSEGDKVVSRWVAEGHNRGRPINTWGIVISRIEDDEIAEDWASSDSLDVVRQLGLRRTLLLGVDWLRGRARVRSAKSGTGSAS